jgi:hypothetical protein
MARRPAITHHAINRFQERVNPSATPQECRAEIAKIVTLGRSRAKPRHWCSSSKPGPGRRFCFWSKRPGVCVITVDGVAVTVLTRELTQATKQAHLRLVKDTREDHRPPARRLEPVGRWQWDGDLGEAA